jgi:hypothetical protein
VALLEHRVADSPQHQHLKTAWTSQQRLPFLKTVLSTGGGAAFVGAFDRRFKR